MSEHAKPTCKVIRGRGTYEGKQELTYVSGIAAETTGSQRICMHLLNLPPKERAKAHLHENHETAIYVVSGQAGMWYGERLEEHEDISSGDFIYIPAGVPAPSLQSQRDGNLHCCDRPDGPQRTRER